MHSARPSSGGSVRAQSNRGHVVIATNTTTLGQCFGAEFGNPFDGGDTDHPSRRLPHHPPASGDGHP